MVLGDRGLGAYVHERTDLIWHYEFQPGGLMEDMWCPIYRDWYTYKKIKAAHLVPFKLGYQTMGDLFGEEDRSYELMWSMKIATRDCVAHQGY